MYIQVKICRFTGQPPRKDNKTVDIQAKSEKLTLL